MVAARFWPSIPLMACVAACGGRSSADHADAASFAVAPDGTSPEVGSGSSSEDGPLDDATGSGGSPAFGVTCDSVGARRPATPSEMAEYCICTAVAEEVVVWVCYGPSPTAVEPDATCLYTTVDPGTGDGSCYVSWKNCSDGQIYGMTCVDHDCHCLVEGTYTSVNLEPRDACPETKADLDALCGWSLQ